MITEFKENLKKYFAKNNQYKITFDMSGNAKDARARVNNVVQRFKEISELILINKEIWIAMIIWNDSMGGAENLQNAGFEISDATLLFQGDVKDTIFNFEDFEDCIILYLYYDEFDFNKVKPLVTAIASSELDIEPSANVTAYFLNFENDNPVLLNLYDDRGMELLLINKQAHKKILEQFNSYVLSYSSS